jgi:hypothetical protein
MGGLGAMTGRVDQDKVAGGALYGPTVTLRITSPSADGASPQWVAAGGGAAGVADGA